MRLAVHEWGAGPRVVLVHGGALGGRHTWRAQRPLAERWRLVAPDRVGHGDSPPGRQDFEIDARLLAEQLLDHRSHLVGHSYGAIVAALAAAARPENVASLTLVEPPAGRVALDDPEVAAFNARLREIVRPATRRPRECLSQFFAAVGVPLSPPDPLTAALENGARQLMGARPPDEAELPLGSLRAAAFPMLVVSGGHAEPFETICDRIASGCGAQRTVIRGADHLVHEVVPAFNDCLERFLQSADRLREPVRRS